MDTIVAYHQKKGEKHTAHTEAYVPIQRNYWG